MTKNEWPMIRQWVLFHGSLYGFSNLHVIDASTDPVVINFLKSAQEKLKINVIFSKANLNEVETEFNQIMHREKKYCDFMIKLDTDELLTVYDPSTNAVTTNSSIIQQYLNSMPIDGRKYKVGYVAGNLIHNIGPSDKCTVKEVSMLTITHFTPMAPAGSFKSFFPAFAFRFCDLGSHYGTTAKGFNKPTTLPSNLALFHYHYQCFERVMEINRQAVISHKYLTGKESEQEAIYILGDWFVSVCSKLCFRSFL